MENLMKWHITIKDCVLTHLQQIYCISKQNMSFKSSCVFLLHLKVFLLFPGLIKLSKKEKDKNKSDRLNQNKCFSTLT